MIKVMKGQNNLEFLNQFLHFDDVTNVKKSIRRQSIACFQESSRPSFKGIARVQHEYHFLCL